ncbi:hypothetical protein ACGGZK_11615 [Agromyces sp. MMS24-K17]|uniref:hypothetical protein n=1 Tax=Agromyces sp. MMS24-K17 TaxID=3372850 RepID=UPI003754BB49
MPEPMIGATGPSPSTDGVAAGAADATAPPALVAGPDGSPRVVVARFVWRACVAVVAPCVLVMLGTAVLSPLLVVLAAGLFLGFAGFGVAGSLGGAVGLVVGMRRGSARRRRDILVGAAIAGALAALCGWVVTTSFSAAVAGRVPSDPAAGATVLLWAGAGAAIAAVSAGIGDVWSRRATASERAGEAVGAAVGVVGGALVAVGAWVAVAASFALPWFDPDDRCQEGHYASTFLPTQAACWHGDTGTAFLPDWAVPLQVALLAGGAALIVVGLVIAALDGRRPVVLRSVVAACFIGAVAAVVASAWIPLPHPAGARAGAGVSAVEGDGGSAGRESGGSGAGGAAGEDGADTGAVAEPALSAPGLEEGRRQFALLADLAVQAVGSDARWRDDPPMTVVETPCDGGTMLAIDAEFAMGEISDTSSDESDRAVVDANVAAQARIAAAWEAAGLGGPERIHGEDLFGGSAGFDAVDSARLAFDWGVAQPRVIGRCLAG